MQAHCLFLKSAISTGNSYLRTESTAAGGRREAMHSGLQVTAKAVNFAHYHLTVRRRQFRSDGAQTAPEHGFQRAPALNIASFQPLTDCASRSQFLYLSVMQLFSPLPVAACDVTT